MWRAPKIRSSKLLSSKSFVNILTQLIRPDHHTSFAFNYMKTVMHVFTPHNEVTNTLKVPYDGCYEVISRADKTFLKNITITCERLQFQSTGSNPRIFVVKAMQAPANNEQTSAVREQKPFHPTASTPCCCHRKPKSRTKRTPPVRSASKLRGNIPSQFHVMQTTVPLTGGGTVTMKLFSRHKRIPRHSSPFSGRSPLQ